MKGILAYLALAAIVIGLLALNAPAAPKPPPAAEDTEDCRVWVRQEAGKARYFVVCPSDLKEKS